MPRIATRRRTSESSGSDASMDHVTQIIGALTTKHVREKADKYSHNLKKILKFTGPPSGQQRRASRTSNDRPLRLDRSALNLSEVHPIIGDRLHLTRTSSKASIWRLMQSKPLVVVDSNLPKHYLSFCFRSPSPHAPAKACQILT
eukprot:3584093-Rhodomonas_salina.1